MNKEYTALLNVIMPRINESPRHIGFLMAAFYTMETEAQDDPLIAAHVLNHLKPLYGRTDA